MYVDMDKKKTLQFINCEDRCKEYFAPYRLVSGYYYS